MPPRSCVASAFAGGHAAMRCDITSHDNCSSLCEFQHEIARVLEVRRIPTRNRTKGPPGPQGLEFQYEIARKNSNTKSHGRNPGWFRLRRAHGPIHAQSIYEYKLSQPTPKASPTTYDPKQSLHIPLRTISLSEPNPQKDLCVRESWHIHNCHNKQTMIV